MNLIHLFTLFYMVVFSNSSLLSLPLSSQLILNIKEKKKGNKKPPTNQPCLMQFEARQAHFIKDRKTLSGTRVFMCNQMQQLA